MKRATLFQDFYFALFNCFTLHFSGFLLYICGIAGVPQVQQMKGLLFSELIALKKR